MNIQFIKNNRIVSAKIIQNKDVNASEYYKDARRKGIISVFIVEYEDGVQEDLTNKHITKLEDISVAQRIDLKYYENKAEYPNSTIQTELKKKFLDTIKIEGGNLKDVEEAIRVARENAHLQFKKEVDRLKAIYREESSKMVQMFKADLEEEFGTKENSKKEQLYNKAVENSGGGFRGIYERYNDLVELVN